MLNVYRRIYIYEIKRKETKQDLGDTKYPYCESIGGEQESEPRPRLQSNSKQTKALVDSIYRDQTLPLRTRKGHNRSPPFTNPSYSFSSQLRTKKG